MKTGIGANERIITGRKKDADKNGMGTKITGTAHFSFTVGSKTSSYPLLEIALSAMVLIGIVDGGYTIEIHIQNTVNMPRLQGEMT